MVPTYTQPPGLDFSSGPRSTNSLDEPTVKRGYKPSDITDNAESYHSAAGPPYNPLLLPPTAACRRRGRRPGGRTEPGASCRPSLGSQVRGRPRPGINGLRPRDTPQCLLWGTRAVHDSDSTSLPEPHHGGRSTSGARVPLPDPVGPAPVRPVGQRSRETGERVRKAAAQFQGRDSDGSHGDCRRSLPRGQKTTVRAMGDSRPSVGTGAPSFFPSFSRKFKKKPSYKISQNNIGMDVKSSEILEKTRYFKIIADFSCL